MHLSTKANRLTPALAVLLLSLGVACSSNSHQPDMPDMRTRPVIYDLGASDGASISDGLVPHDDLSIAPDMKMCVLDSDCQTGLACNGGVCTTCVANDDCNSRVCDRFMTNAANKLGFCPPMNTVMYVDNKNGGCDAGGSGTAASPYCKLSDAVNALVNGHDPGVTSIRILPSTSSYGSIAMTTGTAAIYATLGTVQLSGTTGISVSGTANLLIDGVEVTGLQMGVQIYGTSAMHTLRQSIVQGGTNGLVSGSLTDVTVSGGTLILNSVQLTGNVSSGLVVGNQTTYTVYNSFIVGNTVGQDAAVRFANSSVGTFQYNTVADNIAGAGAAGGIDCGQVSRDIQDSIVSGNSTANGSQFYEACNLVNVVVGASDSSKATGAIHLNPDFMSPGAPNYDYRLLNDAANEACCISKAQTNLSVTRDYFGNPRPGPLSTNYDIGAHEVQ